MMSLLITQCLQNDFVKPLGRYDPLPNLLHIGCDESSRLLGEDPNEGPVAVVMQWAYSQPDEQLRMIHIRDWHDPLDLSQSSHLTRFGSHCVKETPGAEFVFLTPPSHSKQVAVIDSKTLNDFEGTCLAQSLAPYKGSPLHVGIMGVWTEAKILFLAY